MTVIPQSSLLSISKNQRVSNQFHVSLLEKYPQPANSFKGTLNLLSFGHSFEEKRTSVDFQSTDSLQQHISDLEVFPTLLKQMLTNAQTIKCNIEKWYTIKLPNRTKFSTLHVKWTNFWQCTHSLSWNWGRKNKHQQPCKWRWKLA